MVLHAWTEPGEQVRVRVTWSVDVESGRSETTSAANVPDTLRIVEQWLDEVRSRPGRGRR